MIITSAPIIENHPVYQYLGMVTGADNYLVGGIIGEGLARVDSMYETCFSNAVNKIVRKALDMGANAIIGVQTSLTNVANGNMFVTVIGTAVKVLSPEEAKQQEAASRLEEQRRLEAYNALPDI